MLKKIICIAFTFLFIFKTSVKSCSLGVTELSASGAVLYCPDTGEVLFEKNAYSRMSMASTTKIMTSLIALMENMPYKEILLTDEMVNVEGSSSGLAAGDKIKLIDLVYCMLLESGNDAANSVAYAVSGGVDEFVKLMNKKAHELGMNDTSFETPSGLDGDDHYTTAYDMALLAAAALENEDFRQICACKSYTVSFHGAEKAVTLYNHNRLLQSYDGCIGIKTGFTKKSGRCLVSAAERSGVTMIAVTLQAPDDWNDHKKLLDYGFSLYETKEIDFDFSGYGVPVTNGTADHIKINGSNAVFSVKNGSSVDDLKVEIYLEKFLYAPVNKGDIVGYAEYVSGGKTIKRIPLTAAESVAIRSKTKEALN